MNPNGRKRLYPGQSVQRVYVGLNDALLDDLEAELVGSNRGFSETVRSILQQYFDAKKQGVLQGE